MKEFTRAELMEIRERAQASAQRGKIMANWSRAFEALADAADHLDAMLCRTGVPEPSDKEIDGVMAAIGFQAKGWQPQ